MQLENVTDIYPLSPVQQGILYHTVVDPRSSAYVDQLVVTLDGELDPTRLQAAWNTVLQAHEALRAAFLWDGLEEPLQIIRESVVPRWQQWDWCSHSESQRQEQWETLIRGNRDSGFDIAQAPLLHLGLCHWTQQTWKLIVCFHHLILDGWSMQLLLRQVLDVYHDTAAGRIPHVASRLRYRDYIQWQLDQDHETALIEWKQRLAGFTAPNRFLPHAAAAADGPRIAHHQQSECWLEDAETRHLEAFARRHRLTLNSVLLGAWSVVVSRYSGQSDVVVGTTVSGRSAELPNIDQAIGMFINTLPLRTNVDQAEALIPWLQSLQQGQAAVNERDFSSLAAIQKVSDLPAGEELFEGILVVENYPDPTAGDDVRSLRIVGQQHIEQSHYPLALIVVPGPRMELLLIYDPHRVTPDWARQVLQHLRAVLMQFTEHPQRRPRDICLLSDDEIQGLCRWSHGDLQAVEQATIHHWIEEQSRCHPDRIALAFADQQLSYRELDQQANRVAWQLVERDLQPGDRVGLHGEPSLELVIGMLGILKAGTAYVPLDPDYPSQHQQFLLQDAEIRLVLTTQSAALEGVACLRIELGEPASTAPQVATSAEHPAYVIYTSGSSGRPKGVPVSHRNLVFSTQARHQYYDQPAERFLLLSSFAFDSSVAGIFWTLTQGGQLVLCPSEWKQDVQQLTALMHDWAITHTLCLPSLWRLVIKFGEPAELASLQTVIVAGEACDPGMVATHFKQLPETRLFNEYGPTEAAVWCTVHECLVDEDRSATPIGCPIPGGNVFLLDEWGRPVPAGVTGEICVAGPGVTPGYLNLPDQTAHRFVTTTPPLPPQRIYKTGDLGWLDPRGRLIFAGRRDGQIKIRGHRIETDGVAAVLRSLPHVRDAAVAVRDRGRGRGQQLIGWLALPAAAQNPDSVQAIREQLQQRLPAFQVPDLLIPVTSIPKLSNGKVDHRALPEADLPAVAASAKADLPRNRMESGLLEVWKQTLKLPQLGIRDDFFSLGGDSIISIQLVSRSRQAGIYFEPGQLVQYSTIAKLATVARWENGDAESDNEVLVPLRFSGNKTPLVCVHVGGGYSLHYRHLVSHVDPARPVWGLHPQGLEGGLRMESMDEIVRHFNKRLLQQFPDGGFHLVGICIGAVACVEMARQLGEQGVSVKSLTVLDSGPAGFLTPAELNSLRRYLSDKTLPVAAKGITKYAKSRLRHTAARLAEPLQDIWKSRFSGLESRRRYYLELVGRSCRIAYLGFRQQPVSIPIHLIRSSEYQARTDKQFHLRWADFTPELITEVVDAEHDTLLLEPDVSRVGPMLESLLPD